MARFDEQTRTVILSNLRNGMGTERAALGAGVSRVTVWRWLQRGRGDKAKGRSTAYARFADDFEIAEANAIAQLETTLHQQAAEDWRANAWLLSRKRPEEYGDKIDALDRIKTQAIEELFDFLKSKARGSTIDDIIAVLTADAEAKEAAKLTG
jgi:hypothetical protein